MINIVISIVYISFLCKSIYTNLKKKDKKYALYILVDIVFYTTLVILNQRIALSTQFENASALILLIILPIKLWCYRKTGDSSCKTQGNGSRR